MPEYKDNHPLYAAVNAKLAAIAASAPILPSWNEAWAGLESQASLEERLAVYRVIRPAGSLPPDAGFFLVAWVIDQITDGRAAEGLREPEQRLEAIRQKYGLDQDESANADGVPDEYREAMQQSNDAWDAIHLATLEEFGDQDMARVFQENSDEFDQRYEAGRQFFHGPAVDDETEDDDWLDLLNDAVAGCVEADSPMGPLELVYQEEEGFWEVQVYPTPVELVGGARDGEVVVPDFQLDLEQLRHEFESVVEFGWNALGLNWPEGPHVYVEGVFQGHEVYLQVLAYAPEDVEPGLKLDATRRRRRSE